MQNAAVFEERDTGKDESALDEFRQRALITTPVALIDGEVVVGFGRKRPEELLGLE